jgi:hypothetical protein
MCSGVARDAGGYFAACKNAGLWTSACKSIMPQDSSPRRQPPDIQAIAAGSAVAS